MSRVVEIEQNGDEVYEDVNAELESAEDGVNEDGQEAEYELPEKFKGKSQKEIVESYLNLEKEFGRKNNEIGELRSQVDKILALELSGKKEKPIESKKVDLDTLVENPDQVLNEMISSHPAIKQVNDRLAMSEIEKRKAQFEGKHSDWKDVMGTDGFRNWITSSPVRLKMFQKADAEFDYDVGSELLDLYKEVTKKAESQTNEEAEKEKQKRAKALKDATTESKSSGAPSKKIYRRADLIKLRMKDPAKFDSMQDELMLAYKEGRVR